MAAFSLRSIIIVHLYSLRLNLLSMDLVIWIYDLDDIPTTLILKFVLARKGTKVAEFVNLQILLAVLLIILITLLIKNLNRKWVHNNYRLGGGLWKNVSIQEKITALKNQKKK